MASTPSGDHAGAMTENPTQSVPPPSTSFLDDSFARLRSSGYSRDTDGRWFGGVCTGLAQRFGVDPVLMLTGPIDATFFEDVQGPYAETVFHSWMLLVRGVVGEGGGRQREEARPEKGGSLVDHVDVSLWY